MSVTTNGVYLVTEEGKRFLGRIDDILQGSNAEEFPGEGMSPQAMIMDIVQDIVGDPIRNTRIFVIEVRE